MEEVAPRVVAWEPSRAICGACKSKLKDSLCVSVVTDVLFSTVDVSDSSAYVL